jgi:outer membrane protein OmpU
MRRCFAALAALVIACGSARAADPDNRAGRAAPVGTSPFGLDYSGLLAGQFGYIDSTLTLAPMSLVPVPAWSTPDVIGRFYGRLDAIPFYDTAYGRFGAHVGLYSNLNTAHDYRRRIAPFDNINFNLTRFKPRTPLDFDNLFLFHTGLIGSVEVGWAPGVSERTAVTAPLDWGLGGVGGDYIYFFDKPQHVGFHSVSAYGSANTSPRASYYTPRLAGFQAGVSYQPDTRNTGFEFQYGGRAFGPLGRLSFSPDGIFIPPGGMPLEAHTAGFVNVVEAGLNYRQDWGPYRVAASAAGIMGDAINSPSGATFRDLESYQVGLQVGYGGFTVGGGYVWAGDSGYTTRAHWRQRLNQHSLHFGAQYETGRWTMGAAILYGDTAGDPTERSDIQLWVYSAGVRYRATDDLDLGFEFNRILTLSADFSDYENYTALAQVRYRFGGRVQ